MRLPISVPAPGIFSTASKNFFGMKWVNASTRMGTTPDDGVVNLCNLGKALCEALALGIGKCRDTGAGDGVDAPGQRNGAGENGPDHLELDGGVILSAALVGVAVAFEQPRTFGDLERKRGGH